MAAHVIKRLRRGNTLAVDTRRADRLATLARAKIAEAMAEVAQADHPALTRAWVQEAVRADETVRGVHEARAWAAKMSGGVA
jgi:hypothetical protein